MKFQKNLLIINEEVVKILKCWQTDGHSDKIDAFYDVITDDLKTAQINEICHSRCDGGNILYLCGQKNSEQEINSAITEQESSFSLTEKICVFINQPADNCFPHTKLKSKDNSTREQQFGHSFFMYYTLDRRRGSKAIARSFPPTCWFAH